MSSNFNFNKVMLGGRLASDPTAKTTQSGTAVANFCVAVTRDYGGDEKVTDFIDCVAWREQANFVQRFFRKGSPIFVEGTVQKRSWKTQTGETRWATEVVVDKARFVEAKGEGFAPPTETSGYVEPIPEPSYDLEELNDGEDLPF